MKEENDQLLCKRFPLLYADRFADLRSTCMCWGFSCGDGWFDLLLRLSEKLESLIQKLPEDERPSCRAAQVKEKFGMLRFYMTYSYPEMEAVIDEAEVESGRTCEFCGNPGECVSKHGRPGGWLTTLCQPCRKLEESA